MEILKRYARSIKSRTVVTVLIMVLINGVAGVQSELSDLLGDGGLQALNATLGLLAIYFRVNTRAQL